VTDGYESTLGGPESDLGLQIRLQERGHTQEKDSVCCCVYLVSEFRRGELHNGEETKQE
jgi:hypothetical protein